MTKSSCQEIWLALDDTDEREFGCTTFDFNNLLESIESNCEITDVRLVRLWPFAARRTRGNAALAAKITCTESSWPRISDSITIWFNNRFSMLEPDDSKHSAQPVLVAFHERPAEKLYWDTVRSEVTLENRVLELEEYRFDSWFSPRGMNGIIGASAAAAWRGGNDFTWEYIAWRTDTNSIRNVPEKLVKNMSKRYPLTFMNRDPNAGKSLIAPRTPCPVLYGVRGESSKSVESAHKYLQENGAELAKSGRLHRTNQASDDHIESIESAILSTNPKILEGGHVILFTDRKLASFSEGGPINKLAQSMKEGDSIEWIGLESPDGTIHLEKLKLVNGIRNLRRPVCSCGARFKSKGKSQDLKCP
ncbi:MAG: DUF1743 domain-containing protein, partial [Candidatus Thalassarchaeaceae archaeon]|nr:DUF1743 domain-containing protein [Candidatus Thalassarchaeaceae archaeon]